MSTDRDRDWAKGKDLKGGWDSDRSRDREKEKDFNRGLDPRDRDWEQKNN